MDADRKPDSIVSVYTYRPLEDAVETATVNLIDWLITDYGFTPACRASASSDSLSLTSVTPYRVSRSATSRSLNPTVPVTGTLQDAVVLKEMITSVLANGRVDSRGVGIIGWSYGPWHGAQLCARDGRVRAMVSISGTFHPFDTRPGNRVPESLARARIEAQWKAGKRLSPEPLKWAPDTSVYDVAQQIRCPMLLVYGALEPEVFRAQAEELAALVPTAKARAWRSGVHVLFNVPEAFEEAADWMKQQLLTL